MSRTRLRSTVPNLTKFVQVLSKAVVSNNGNCGWYRKGGVEVFARGRLSAVLLNNKGMTSGSCFPGAKCCSRSVLLFWLRRMVLLQYTDTQIKKEVNEKGAIWSLRAQIGAGGDVCCKPILQAAGTANHSGPQMRASHRT